MKKQFTDLEKIIIDTDPGHDDALAIMLMVLSGKVDIKGVTTVAGNCTVQEATNNARFILDLMNSQSSLYSGSSQPLSRKLITANVHGKGGLAGAPIKKKVGLTGNAIEKIIEIVHANPGDVSILVIGPETNIAKAFTYDPELPSLIKQLVIMGGAINVPGNKNRVAEFNIFVDPEAAEIVFQSKVKKILIPLDICNEVALSLADFNKLRNSRVYEPLMKMMEKYIEGIEKFEGLQGALVYDAIAAYYLLNPKNFLIQAKDIRIESKGDLTRGMTVLEKRLKSNKKENIDLVVGFKKETFIKDFIRILSSN